MSFRGVYWCPGGCGKCVRCVTTSWKDVNRFECLRCGRLFKDKAEIIRLQNSDDVDGGDSGLVEVHL